MSEESNSANSYEVDSSADGLLHYFTTRNDIQYTISLIMIETGYSSCYSLSLSPDTKLSPRGIDPKIRNTVVAFIGRFLKQDHHMILYVCDVGDGRQEKRHLAFTRWCSYGMKIFSQVGVMDYKSISPNGYLLFLSVVFNTENPLLEKAIEELENLIGDF